MDEPELRMKKSSVTMYIPRVRDGLKNETRIPIKYVAGPTDMRLFILVMIASSTLFCTTSFFEVEYIQSDIEVILVAIRFAPYTIRDI